MRLSSKTTRDQPRHAMKKRKRKPKSTAALAYEAARRSEKCPVCRKNNYPPWRTLSLATKAAWYW